MDEILKSIQDRLAESGEYERLTKHLHGRLQASGWFSEVNELALEELQGLENPNFDRVSKKIEPRALSMVPEDVKLELLGMIKHFLDTNVEKAP